MTYNIEYFRDLEEKMIAEEIASKFSLDNANATSPTEKEVNSAFKLVHTKMENSLISFYMEKCQTNCGAAGLCVGFCNEVKVEYSR